MGKVQAYVAIVSLANTLAQMKIPHRPWIPFDKRFFMLQYNALFLADFLETEGNGEIGGLDIEMARFASAAEDFVECYILDLNCKRFIPQTTKNSRFYNNFSASLSRFWCFIRFNCHFTYILVRSFIIVIKAMFIKRMKEALNNQTSSNRMPLVFSRSEPDFQDIVGLEEKVMCLIDRLTTHTSKLKIITIVGMGGIGKTTLAGLAFQDPFIVYHFEIRCWVKISQEYTVRNIIFDLLIQVLGIRKKHDCDENLAAFIEQMSKLDDSDLGERLYKTLYCHTYLIVMDDLWCTKFWKKVRVFFPDNGNGSRIIITSRLLNVAEELSSFSPLEMEFLDVENSWELLKQRAFGCENFLPELIRIGREIARNCMGHPLTIIVIGGLLATNKTVLFWQKVSINLMSTINSMVDDKWRNILHLSYSNLPIYLKPCFLHVAEISDLNWNSCWGLVKVWLLEGLIKPVEGKNLVDVGFEYLSELRKRNLISVRGYLYGSAICCVHDLLRDLCLMEAEKENISCLIDISNHSIFPGIESKRRFSLCRTTNEREICNTMVGSEWSQSSMVRSLRLDGPLFGLKFRFLRVLLVVGEFFSNDIMQLPNLQMLCIKDEMCSNTIAMFPPSICQLWNLQTIIIENSETAIYLPIEIWEMPQLCHIESWQIFLPQPPPDDTCKKNSYILPNLEILKGLTDFRFTEDIFERLPRLTILRVIYNNPVPYFCIRNIALFDYLVELECNIDERIPVEELKFPDSLVNLRLNVKGLTWEDMTIAGSLPNLQQFLIFLDSVKGEEWCPLEGDFCSLKGLIISRCGLVRLKASRNSFPMLEELVLVDVNMEEIPLDFGEIPTLRSIILDECSDSTVFTVKQIAEEQESMGNDILKVSVYFHKPRPHLLSLETKNFEFIINNFN